ncbi:signal transduction histidine kinase [Natranaerovirga hydrolytica]|uniref:histidine kinase n=1 Tax=Natranaerovirga hydrolytica TaxID=680378 RepID=A0A4R1MQF3_9FIRM|nr:histidine kinase [Natranaerovirga hydrolytica]TCK92759.1 signal transduction histidine kinase [Natranaerovirga hydrolytica]
MDERKNYLTPEKFGNIYRSVGIFLLGLLWVTTDSNSVGFFFILFLVIMSLLRWRFKQLKSTLVFDQMVCIYMAYYWSYAQYGLVFSFFDAIFMWFPIAVLPSVLFVLFYNANDILWVVLLQSFFCGIFLKKWNEERKNNIKKMDLDSLKKHGLESLKEDLLMANKQVARMAEISERSRISREIHDHAGHEIIGAYISLQVLEDMLEENDEETKEMFELAMKRLERGIEKIRESVHNLAPVTKMGIDTLQALCDDFSFAPIEFNVFGDTSKVPVHLWSILEPSLKEGLTNIMRHSEAKKISVTLDITPYIVRLCVENDGIIETIKEEGIGIKNLRYRVKSIGGNLSTDTTDGFRLICVMPIEHKGSEQE